MVHCVYEYYISVILVLKFILVLVFISFFH